MKKDSSAPALTQYPLKVQAIRPKGARPKLYVYIPMPLAAAMGLNPGDTVQWELLDRDELHLIRLDPAPPLTPKRARRHK
ncbi:MAG: hypothetical protein EHM79_19125 [Geobacter sp.]|jgi:hypothetical protein|nr:MAG: hypothetical protein EHM79_19125 [Geobacter sp.]